MVVEADGDDQGTQLGKLTGAVQQILADLLRVPRGAHCIIQSDDEEGYGGAVVKRLSELVTTHVGDGLQNDTW